MICYVFVVNSSDWIKEVKRRSRDWKYHVMAWLNATRFPVLVVGYENLMINTYTELKRILDFVGYPYSKNDVLCAVKSSEAFHRKHKKDIHAFSPELQQIVNNDIKAVNESLLKHNISLL